MDILPGGKILDAYTTLCEEGQKGLPFPVRVGGLLSFFLCSVDKGGEEGLYFVM